MTQELNNRDKVRKKLARDEIKLINTQISKLEDRKREIRAKSGLTYGKANP